MSDTLHDVLVTFFDLKVWAAAFPLFLRQALPNTIILTIGSVLAGLVVGLALALMMLSRHRRWRWPAQVFVDVFRGFPPLVTIFVVGQGLPLAGLSIFGSNAYAYAILAIGLVEGAYIGEIIRAGILGVDVGQSEASRSLGMGPRQTMWFVVLPQAVRRVLPPLTGQAIICIKATALVFVLGLQVDQTELFSAAQLATSEFASMSPMVLAGLMYLVLTVPLTHAVNAWERRLRLGRQPSRRTGRRSAAHPIADTGTHHVEQ